MVAMKRAAVVAALVAGLAAMPPAFAQGKKGAYYEPSQRLRTALDTCMKDEVMNGANCVKKCQGDFKMDLTSRPPICFSNRPDAKYEPPKTSGWVPPTQKVPQGKKGPAGNDG